jgi:hypothetical protein
LRKDFILEDADQLSLLCGGRVRNIVADEDGAETRDGERIQIEIWMQVFQFIRHFAMCDVAARLMCEQPDRDGVV